MITMKSDYKDFMSLNGNKRIAPTSLKTTSIVNPTILNGRRISQTIGNKINRSNASGQHNTNNIQISTRAKRVLIKQKFQIGYATMRPKIKLVFLGHARVPGRVVFSNPYSAVIAFVQTERIDLTFINPQSDTPGQVGTDRTP